MIISKNNDVDDLIQQLRQRETPQKERKLLLAKIEDVLRNVTNFENLPVKWIYLLDNACWPILTKNERNDTKTAAMKVIRIVGTLLFDSIDYPEFLIWIGTLYQAIPKKNDDTKADLVYSVYFIVGSISQKIENQPFTDVGNVQKSLKWMIDVLPTATTAVYNKCLKGIVLVSNTFPKVSEELFEDTMLAIFSNLPDLNTHDKHFELLIDTVTRFSDLFHERPAFAETIFQKIRPELKNDGNMRELKKRMKLMMAVVKMAKSQKMLEETNQMISELSMKCEEHDRKWSSAAMITVVCDVFNELLILGKDDDHLRKSVEESLCHVLKDLNLSKQNTKEKQAFFNSLAKIVKQLPAESNIKTRIHEIVFNEDTGLFADKNRDNRMFGHNTIYKDLINLISVLLTPTSLNHLQTTYSDIRKIMIASMSHLQKCEKEPMSDVIRWHESILLLLLSSLQNISCAKSSLIVMIGIRPSIFEFFTQELPLTEYWLAANHPQVYHLFVAILVGHLKSHDFYIPQSDYILRGDNSTIGQTKRDYAKKQVQALSRIMETFGDLLWKRTRLLISSWLQLLVTTACEQQIGEDSFGTKEWIKLRSTVVHQSVLGWNNDSVSQAIFELDSSANWPEISAEIEMDIAEKTKKAKRKEAAAIWEAGDCNVYIRQSVSPAYQMAQERQQKFISCTSFGADEFTVVTNFLLRQIVPTTFKKGALHWMDEMLDTMTRKCRPVVPEKNKSSPPDEFIEKWDWAINQTANFCIVNKMKTPLGKPMQTFAAFAAEINRLAKEVMSRKVVSKDKNNKTVEENGVLAGPPLKYSIQWLRVHLLLKFIEVLEKLMISAIHGGSGVFNLTEIPMQSRQFFTTNSASCEVWLNRVYYPALIVAHFNGYYGLVIRFGSNALTHYSNRKEADEKIVGYGVSTACLMALSMAILGDPMEIVGLRRRVRDELRTEMGQTLMEALGEMAHARYENALVGLETVIVTDTTLNETLKIIIQLAMIDMLNRIRLPQAAEFYKKTLFGDDPDSITEDFKSIEMLTRFEKVSNGDQEKRQVVDWSAKERLALVESAFTQTMRRTELLDHQKELFGMGALALVADTSCKLYSDISSTSLIIANLVDKMTGVAQTRNKLTDDEFFDKFDNGNDGDKLAICRKIMHWSRHIKHFRCQSSNAHSEIIRLSRKTSNCDLAHFHINSAIRGDKLTAWQRLEVDRQRLKLMNGSHGSTTPIREMNGVFGSLADVFITSIQLKSNFDMLPDGPVRDKMLGEGYFEEIGKREEHMSRASIQLAEFFDSLPELDNVLAPDLFPTVLWSEVQRRSDDLSCGYNGIVGALFQLASEMCPSLSKSHLKMAQWAFEMARIENSPSGRLMAVCQFGETPQENEELWKCLEMTSIAQLEKHVRKAVGADVRRTGLILAANGHFLQIWENVRQHRTKFLSIAVSSYFQFIQHMSAGDFPYSKKEETTLATLRILELLVKHGDVLVDIINEGLSNTNVHVWKEILPQLFARLSHPSEHIRKTLVDLISRVCTAAPHAVVFQVVSGAASSTEAVDELEDQQNDDRTRVRVCCEQLESNMAQSYPSLVRDVRQFVAELERINLLNEEKWSVVLGTMEHEMEKRLALIRAENAKTSQSTHLTAADKEHIIGQKTALLTSQIFDVLDELYQQTVVEPPETKNEEDFVLAYADILSNAFTESKLTRIASPEKSWAPYKSLIANFVHRYIKKGVQTLETEDISPYLASLVNSCVPMPGQESVEFDRVVSIAKVTKQVIILPTKTRPKKLGFVGSDGKPLAFLFKGREDLHLDERVMQFLRLCNIMLHPGKKAGSSRRQVADYQAHHYAVIPLGPRSGLIKWVEGATPMFHIYRKWQLKEKALRQAAKKNGQTVGEIERPSEMYHKMIRQAFDAHKIDASIASDRSKWPETVLEEVFAGLAAKTPSDLISRELWMRANDAMTWWSVTRRYARSLAVMSMVGSVLGLGDRHMDNLLVDLKQGHVVHIDYNICFDKGRNLRIPETVPFRLTRNMRHALGPSSLHGTFGESCVHVLSTLRNGRLVLTMLLDAFVFDPLVDWTNHEHSSTSGVSLALQLAVYGANWKTKARERIGETMMMLRLRVTEIQSAWMQNRDDLLVWMKKVTASLMAEQNLMGVGIYAQQRVKAGTELREAVTRHQALAKEIRPLIRAIGKEREEFAEYLKFYKQAFIDPLLKGHTALRHEVNIDLCVHNFNIVMQNIDIVFGSLITLADQPLESSNRTHQPQFKAPPGLENVWVVKQDQHENPQAREVVKRVEGRLNGWLDASDRKLTPREQAEMLIAEATDDSKLAKMYEGWTAWV